MGGPYFAEKKIYVQPTTMVQPTTYVQPATYVQPITIAAPATPAFAFAAPRPPLQLLRRSPCLLPRLSQKRLRRKVVAEKSKLARWDQVTAKCSESIFDVV